MQIVTANMFTSSPFRASIDLMYRYQESHDRMLSTAQELNELRNKIISRMGTLRMKDYYRDPFEIDVMI
ncbi:MAG: hypothetical protein H8E46_10710 [FCB group bacterium]|nr:hypothetical protein [FCB group bacterium]